MILKVADIIGSDLALFHQEGLDIFCYLNAALLKGESLQLSFEGIKRCSTQFLNASVGNLYLNNQPQLVEGLITYDFSSLDILKDKIAEVKQNALNSSTYNSYIESAVN